MLLYLKNQGIDLEQIFDFTDLNLEFLNDPISWLEAHLLEDFLYQLHQNYENNQPHFIKKAGEHSPELKAWGVLDGVLKMMDQASDFYAQPERLISYFISPAPQIHAFEHIPGLVTFDTPISSTEFPFVSEFLKAAFGSLPAYMGKSHAKVKWEETQIHIEYVNTSTEDEGVKENEATEVSPELIDSVMRNLELKQFEIENKNKALNLKEEELRRLKKDLGFLMNKTKEAPQKVSDQVLSSDCQKPLDELLLNMQKFNDYFSRAQQLITLLVGKKRLDPQVRAAMKRVNWEQVAEVSPILIQKIYSQIEKLDLCVDVSDIENSLEFKNLATFDDVKVDIKNKLGTPCLDSIQKKNKKEKDLNNNSFLIDNRPI